MKLIFTLLCLFRQVNTENMFRPLKDILKKRAEQYSFTDELLVSEVLKLWDQFIKEEFGQELENKTRAFDFKKGVLLVKIFQPNLVDQIKLREKQTIEKINIILQRNFIDTQKIKKVIYKISDN